MKSMLRVKNFNGRDGALRCPGAAARRPYLTLFSLQVALHLALPPHSLLLISFPSICQSPNDFISGIVVISKYRAGCEESRFTCRCHIWIGVQNKSPVCHPTRFSISPLARSSVKPPPEIT